MKFFVDTADVSEIRELAETGLLDGVTTNPSLVLKANRPYRDILKDVCEVVPGPVSAEVAATDLEGMLAEGRALAKIADNIVIKVPLTWDGLKACRTFLNVTLCFSANQALLAAKAGASFISPFIGRLDDINLDGMEVIAEIRSPPSRPRSSRASSTTR
jgi:transaldolase